MDELVKPQLNKRLNETRKIKGKKSMSKQKKNGPRIKADEQVPTTLTKSANLQTTKLKA